MTKRYRVLTAVSSFEDGRSLLHETDSLRTAQRECREWSDWDDVLVWVEDINGQRVYQQQAARF